ncbi:MAG TPA: Maf family protein [Acidimicrobiia bacterium]
MADARPRQPQQLVLASQSPRRADLLRSIGLTFDVVPADIDETRRHDEPAVEYVERLAREKAERIAARRTDAVVLAADTCVAIDDDVLGKPADHDEARTMLQRLSGRDHLVHTGVAVGSHHRIETGVATTSVSFNDLDTATIDWYLATGEAFDKAGGYAMQSFGGVFVRAIHGSPSNVVGLPLHLVTALARDLGVDLAQFRG